MTMPYKITQSGKLRKQVAALQRLAADPSVLTGDVAEITLREALRRAPRGRTRGMAGLRASLFVTVDTPTTFTIRSDKPYAKIQNQGGTITAGTGKLGARMLAVPVNDEARRMSESLGSGTSLRSKNLVMVQTGKQLLLVEPLRRVKGKRKRRSTGKAVEAVRIGAIFVLKRSVTLPANPAPDGYAPKLSDPAIAPLIQRCVMRRIREAQKGVQ